MTFIIAGKAGDAKLARCGIAAKKVQLTCPLVFHRVESKHPDDWPAFLESVFFQRFFFYVSSNFSTFQRLNLKLFRKIHQKQVVRQQDFVQYRGHPGPIYWSVDGCSVGTGDDFVGRKFENMCPKP